MKKLLFLTLTIFTLFSCSKDAEDVNSGAPDASVLNLTINVNKAFSRSIEGGHEGANDAEVSPKIFAVSVIFYSDVAQLGVTDLTEEQIKNSVWGNYKDKDGNLGGQTSTAPAGVKIGLPKGTTHVDVVVNRTPAADYNPETNINFVNYRDNKNGTGGANSFGKDNFDRVILTTEAYGRGVVLSGNEVASTDIPTYKIEFSVKPHLARMEVYGGINVSAAKVWIDGYKNQWRTMTVAAYKTASGEDADEDGYYTKGSVKGTKDNGFDENIVYISEYYWYKAAGSIADPVERKTDNTFATETEVDNSTGKAGWVKQPYYEGAGLAAQVMWYPNRYYAVDVESVFVNNIKVRGPERTPYLHPWPGSNAATGWLDWYKAFHMGGWHTTGTSTGNLFLCMGNMWDRIATSDTNMEISFPDLGGVSKMDIITGKAKPVTDKSKYYDTDRNLGIATDRAAGYGIYAQSKQTSTSATDATALRNEMPHIILKLKAYKNATDYASGTYISGKEFITVTLFSEGAAGSGKYITDFKGGYIYRFNMNDLLYSFVGDVPVPGGKPTDGVDPKDPVDPDPEMPEAQLIVTVKVLPWKVMNIYPNV